MKAFKLRFELKDENDDFILIREVTFPFPIDAEFIDAEIAKIFINIPDNIEIQKVN